VLLPRPGRAGRSSSSGPVPPREHVLYGDIFDLGDGEFTLHPGLETGHFEAMYPMVRRDGRQSGYREIAITVEFAVGEVTTSRDSSS
jgi:hypothetical protein